MPSTVVHVSLAGLIAAGLLGRAFEWRSLAVVVVAATVFVDLDVFLGWWIGGAHRAAFHTLLLPALLAGLIVYDTRYREASVLRSRFAAGPRIAWVTVAAVTFGAIGPDLFFNGVNVFYPVHDQFYKLNGEVLLSNQRGFVQTFVDLSPPEPNGSNATNATTPTGGEGESGAVGSTEEVHYRTGVDPSRGEESANVERVFPVVRSGQQALVVLTSAFVVGSRLLGTRRSR
ncbi:metal-dependent hydrolase [Halapricum sp. CBA1109]|uniref:metal-dependent hydrolase n=1 Tax=Halapricum sp. CBA1109 TaxID=2668068 RepID=UPI0012FBC2EA|nr:metal-dependent hydrolase [Halapricum sp. CBA1109]MUV88683.1 metal-dependent hydrolase [Halapricum sp. CBA1109]